MTVREYIGARYVPIFMGEWDNTVTYEPLSIVTYQGNSYTSRQAVPTGIAITNETFWTLTGNYNAQVEAYRAEVQTFNERITDNANAINTINSDNWVTANRIADDAVTSDKIADDAVTSDKIADDAITSSKIADDAVTSNKIADDAITSDKIADDAITSDKIADDAITGDKLANNAITPEKFSSAIVRSNFIMPEYIGSFTNYSGMRKELNSADNHPIFAQSMAMPDDENVKFFVVNKTDSNTHIVSANMTDNTVSESSVNHEGWGHCNHACFNRSNNRYYINIGSDTGNQVNSILVTDSAFNEIERLEPPNRYYFGHMLYDQVTEKMWFVGGLDIYEFNPATNVFTEMPYKLSESIPGYDGSSTAALQGGAIYNNVYACPVAATGHSSIKIYDITTGERIFTFALPKNSYFYPIGEVEGCAYDSNGNFYFNSIMCYDTGIRYYSTTVLYKLNFFTGMGVESSYTYSEQPDNIHVECANYSGFRSDGSPTYPCKSLEELSLMLVAKPLTRKVNLGLDSQYSTATAQTWFGFIQVTGLNVTFHWAGNGLITIQGGIIARDNAIIKLRNRATFTPFPNANGDVFIRVDDSILLASTIVGQADAAMQATFSAIVLCIGTGMFMSQGVVNNTGATAAVTNFGAGFGYVIAPVKAGSW